MKNYLEKIREKLINEIEIEEIEIVDNSHKHRGHKFFSPKKMHLKLEIKSLYLSSISKVSAQKKVMKILNEDLKTRIHALEISITK